MLAADATQRNKAATLARQGTLDGHLQEIPQAQHIVPYSDAAFRNAAIEWLVSTDQVRTQDTWGRGPPQAWHVRVLVRNDVLLHVTLSSEVMITE